jgi:hypothetical protein
MFVLYASLFWEGCQQIDCNSPTIGILAMVWPDQTDT